MTSPTAKSADASTADPVVERRARAVWRVIAIALFWLGGITFVGGALILFVAGGLPGGAAFDVALVTLFALGFGLLCLVVALTIAAVDRMRTWWVPIVLFATGAVVIAGVSAGLPERLIWPAIRADLERLAPGECPSRAALLYEIRDCVDIEGRTAYRLDNGFLNSNALIRIPAGESLPNSTPVEGSWYLVEDLGDGWYLLALAW